MSHILIINVRYWERNAWLELGFVQYSEKDFTATDSNSEEALENFCKSKIHPTRGADILL